jgi:hypothetical protein
MMRHLAWGSVKLESLDANHHDSNIVFSRIESIILDLNEFMNFCDFIRTVS